MQRSQGADAHRAGFPLYELSDSDSDLDFDQATFPVSISASDWHTIAGDTLPHIAVGDEVAEAEVWRAAQREIESYREYFEAKNLATEEDVFSFFFGPQSELVSHLKTALGIDEYQTCRFLGTILFMASENCSSARVYEKNKLLRVEPPLTPQDEYKDLWGKLAAGKIGNLPLWVATETLINQILGEIYRSYEPDSGHKRYLVVDDDKSRVRITNLKAVSS